MATSWTEDRIAMLARLWAEGYTASQIANHFGDITRNAVCGKVWREGLEPRMPWSRNRSGKIALSPPKPQQAKPPQPAPKPEPKIHPIPLPETKPARPETEMQNGPRLKTILELEPGDCRYPAEGFHPGEPGFGFCGRPREYAMAYCEDHCARAFNNRKRAERREAA